MNLKPDIPSITESFVKEKKDYKYERIQLTLNPERRDILERACSTLGLDVRRIEHHDQDLIWEILGYVDEANKIRAWADLHFSKVLEYGRKK